MTGSSCFGPSWKLFKEAEQRDGLSPWIRLPVQAGAGVGGYYAGAKASPFLFNRTMPYLESETMRTLARLVHSMRHVSLMEQTPRASYSNIYRALDQLTRETMPLRLARMFHDHRNLGVLAGLAAAFGSGALLKKLYG